MPEAADPLDGLDALPWDRIVYWYEWGSDIPPAIRALDTDDHRVAERHLLACLEHQNGIIPASVVAVPFIGRMLLSGQVRDRQAATEILRTIEAAAKSILRGRRSLASPPERPERLMEALLWPSFVSEDEDAAFWESWGPGERVLATAAVEIEAAIDRIFSDPAIGAGTRAP